MIYVSKRFPCTRVHETLIFPGLGGEGIHEKRILIRTTLTWTLPLRSRERVDEKVLVEGERKEHFSHTDGVKGLGKMIYQIQIG